MKRIVLVLCCFGWHKWYALRGSGKECGRCGKLVPSTWYAESIRLEKERLARVDEKIKTAAQLGISYEVYSTLCDVMRAEYVPAWLNSPVPALGGKTPRDAIATGRFEEVERVILLIGSGMPI